MALICHEEFNGDSPGGSRRVKRRGWEYETPE